jgi:beta-N-acetylhexosaminidase
MTTAVCAVAVLAAAYSPAVAAVPARPTVAAAATVDCQPLTRREKAAQTVMTGIPSTSATAATIQLVERDAGTVILFGANIVSGEQLRRLTRSLRDHARARMLVAVDEEGGRVSRLGEKGIVDRLPSARELSRTKTVTQIRRIAKRLGEQMAAVGMDWNLAPVLDVADADPNSVIGDRSFSGNPDRVAAVGRAFAEGLRAGGVKATGKHFPGHGRTTTDSHEALPTVTASLRQLRRVDIKPFKAALPALDAVMSAHVRYTAIDDRLPASLSRAATKILRDDLGYRGILITDSLVMGAITGRWSVSEAAEKALRNGADIVMVTDHTRTAAVTTRLAGAVRDGRIPKVRLHQAAARVLRAKGYGDAKIDCLLGR